MATIDVIIPVHNRQDFLSRAVASVVGQSFKDWRLIVVDDGSNPEIKAWLKEQCLHKWQDVSMDYVDLPLRQGVSAARNHGVRYGSSAWVAFLDSDDEWVPTKLEKQMALSAAQPELSFIHTDEIWVRHGVRVNPHKKHAKPSGHIFSRCLPLCCVSPSSVMMTRELFDKFEGFRSDFPVCEDYELWLRISAETEVGFVDERLVVKYGGHADQLSRSQHAMDYWRVKALTPFLTHPTLSIEEKIAVATTMVRKCGILLQGYRKHNNMTNFDQVEGWQTLARRFLLPFEDTVLTPLWT